MISHCVLFWIPDAPNDTRTWPAGGGARFSVVDPQASSSWLVERCSCKVLCQLEIVRVGNNTAKNQNTLLLHWTIWTIPARLTVSTTTSSGRTCTVSCRRHSTSVTWRTCRIASSWSAIDAHSHSTLNNPSSLFHRSSFFDRISAWLIIVMMICISRNTNATVFSLLYINHVLHVVRKALGALGFYSSLYFVKYIYGSIKCDWRSRLFQRPKLTAKCG